jgi:hypothetical protein
VTLDEAVQYCREVKSGHILGSRSQVIQAASVLERAVAYYQWASFGPARGADANLVRAASGVPIPVANHDGRFWTWHGAFPEEAFGRCIFALKLFPELRLNLHKVSDAYPGWRALVDNWDELEALYGTERLRVRLEELRRLSG